MRLDVEDEEFGHGGMRVVKKATVYEGLDHPLLRKFAHGTSVLVKEYNEKVENAAEAANRTVKSIAKKVQCVEDSANTSYKNCFKKI